MLISRITAHKTIKAIHLVENHIDDDKSARSANACRAVDDYGRLRDIAVVRRVSIDPPLPSVHHLLLLVVDSV